MTNKGDGMGDNWETLAKDAIAVLLNSAMWAKGQELAERADAIEKRERSDAPR